MKRIKLEQNTPEWMEWRKGKITGSRLKDIIVKRGNQRKLGFYEVLAERLTVPHENDNDDVMERGHTLEQKAVDEFTEVTGYKVKTDCGVWVSDTNEHIALSPDGEIDEAHAVEVKCLSSARHLQAYFEQEIPSDYEAQVCQYFIVNEKLEQLYFVFYDPRIPAKPLHYIIVNREDWGDRIKQYNSYQTEALDDIDQKINQLTSF